MVGVLKRVIHESRLSDVVWNLLRKFNCVKIATRGSRGHQRMGLRPEQVLVSAWSRKKEE